METAGTIRFGTPGGRGVLAATVLGAGVAFLDGTVVNVALPSIGRDLDSGMSGLQWILDGYLVTLSALLLLGGSLGDLFGRRRVYVTGLVWFTAASVLCGVAPDEALLIAARVLQGAGAAMLVPGSLAIISASFRPEERGRAVGAWSAFGGVAGAVGPFLGGWLVDAASWRWVFFINLPVAAAAIFMTLRYVPESRDPDASGHIDVPGAITASIGLAAVAFALIEGSSGFGTREIVAAVVGVAALVGFVMIERRSPQPMLPLELFRSTQFTGANITTFAVYAGLGGAIFLVVLQLQVSMGYSALEAGASLLPITVLMLTLSSRTGALAQRIGPRLPMTVGPLIIAVGLLLLSRVGPGTHYGTGVFIPLVVFGLGLALTVAPLTTAVLAAVEDRHLGVGSAVNNATARVAGMLAVAVLPAAAGLDLAGGPAAITAGYATAMRICAVVCAIGGLCAFVLVRRSVPHAVYPHPSITQACHDGTLADVA